MNADIKTKDEVAATTQFNIPNNLKQIEDDANEQRIQHWQEKRVKNSASYDFIANKETKQVDPRFLNKELTNEQQVMLHASTISAATGSACPAYGLQIFDMALRACFYRAEDIPSYAATTQNALLAFQPQDEIEGHLVTRLITLHDHYMQYMARARSAATQAVIDSCINNATKLMRLYNETLQTLNKHRRGGEQRVVVQHQHINVHEGGQAVGC